MKSLTLLAVLLTVCAGDDCFTSQPTDPGVEAQVPCVFPFTYKGTTYDKCTAVDHEEGLEWCSTQVDSEGGHVTGSGRWGVCTSPACPREQVCPPGWSHLQSGCYRLLDREGGLTKDSASQLCLERGGYLADISSQGELGHIMDWYKDNLQTDLMFQADALWLGIHNDTERKAWISEKTGQPISYSHWLDTEPDHEDDNEKCVGIFADRNFNFDFQLKDFGWFDLPCDTPGFDFWKKYRVNMKALCERDVLEPPKPQTSDVEEITIGDNGCRSGWTRLNTGCYLFHRLPSTYREAVQFCSLQKSHLAEIETKEEFEAVESAWRQSQPKDEQDRRSYWLGLNDLSEEGSWVAERSGRRQNFTAWHGDEPNNWGGKTPGEDCTIAHLWSDDFQWYDAACDVRGFAMHLGSGVTMNPLCEHEAGTLETTEAKVEGRDQDWVSINNHQYKFIKVSYGVSKAEAEHICKGNGGILAEIKGEKTRLALKDYYKKNVLEVKDSTNVFQAALNFFRSSPEGVKYAWWIGASDEEEEGYWKWNNKQNLTYSSWYFWGGDKQTFNKDGSDNPTVLDFGDFDCAAIVDTDLILGIPDWGENEKYRERLKAEDNFQWVTASCLSRSYYPDAFHFRLTPLCQKV